MISSIRPPMAKLFIQSALTGRLQAKRSMNKSSPLSFGERAQPGIPMTVLLPISPNVNKFSLHQPTDSPIKWQPHLHAHRQLPISRL